MGTTSWNYSANNASMWGLTNMTRITIHYLYILLIIHIFILITHKLTFYLVTISFTDKIFISDAIYITSDSLST